MIYTVTFNPSLDYIVDLDSFQYGKTNRTKGEQLFAGGKGLNVSSVLWSFGIPSTALGFTAGFTGEEIERKIKASGFSSDFIHLQNGFSRINIKLRSYDGTEINGQGPLINRESIRLLYRKLDQLQKGDFLVLAGSIPDSLSPTVYRDIMEYLSPRGVEFIVDATKSLLWNTLVCHPFLIKPNRHELEEIFHITLTDNDALLSYAKRLQEQGARNVLISLGGDGAVLLSETGDYYQMSAPCGTVINSVGAGDSMIAGFIAGWLKKKDYEYALKLGISAGSASAFSELLATKEGTEQVLLGLS